MRSIPDCPTVLPEPLTRTSLGGPSTSSFEVPLEVVTPILGGAARTRELDEVDVIRPATLRGHLRFWWRALYGHQWREAGALSRHEAALWGRAAANDQGGRSNVEIQVTIDQVADPDDQPFNLQNTPGAYALWPARETNTEHEALRRLPGTRFTLAVRCPAEREDEVRAALRAWILFGGYGSRTRRGVGSLTVTEDEATWLPASADLAGLTALFGRDVLDPAAAPPLGALPLLAGAGLVVGNATNNAQSAWLTALDRWLKEFRQGTGGANPARQPGFAPEPNRPSISNWPEADKLRHLHPGPISPHTPRHNAVPAWPRAAFGLPIQVQFQTRARGGGTYQEPRDAQLQWTDGHCLHDRLASPLIVKALPLTGGRFAPIALWLHRAYPAGEVVVVQGRAVPRSAAGFDLLVAPGDPALFPPLADPAAAAAGHGRRLRTAFFNWVATRGGTVVAP